MCSSSGCDSVSTWLYTHTPHHYITRQQLGFCPPIVLWLTRSMSQANKLALCSRRTEEVCWWGGGGWGGGGWWGVRGWCSHLDDRSMIFFNSERSMKELYFLLNVDWRNNDIMHTVHYVLALTCSSWVGWRRKEEKKLKNYEDENKSTHTRVKNARFLISTR